MKGEHMYTDTELLDFLQALTDEGKYTGMVILRDSEMGRGWRLHETSLPGATSDVRATIAAYIDASRG